MSSLEQAIALYRGPFLAGLSAGDSPAFEDWLLLRAEADRRACSRAGAPRFTTDRTGRLRRGGALGTAPARDRAVQRAGAQAVDDGARPWRRPYDGPGGLRGLPPDSQELGCEPEDETQALCSQIRDGTLTQPHLPPAVLRSPSPAPSPRAIAIHSASLPNRRAGAGAIPAGLAAETGLGGSGRACTGLRRGRQRQDGTSRCPRSAGRTGRRGPDRASGKL